MKVLRGSGFVDVKLDFEGFFSDARARYEMGFVEIKDAQSCVGSVGGPNDSEPDGVVTESSAGNEEENRPSQKRKRECRLPMLDWVRRVAKNPCDLAIGPMPERSKWKAYGSQHVWKQALLAREAMLLKANVDSEVEQSIWKKKQKMHPKMYDDHRLSKSTVRCSQRLVSAKETPTATAPASKNRDFSESSSTGNPSDVEDQDSFWGANHRRKRIPVGPHFQADVPEWPGAAAAAAESQSKWLGTRVWPLEKGEAGSCRRLIERDPIGKGRRESGPGSCGCPVPGSFDCVRFHVDEKTERARLELGPAFGKWRFNEMGDRVARSWSPSDQRRFEDTVRSNPESSGRRFWDELAGRFGPHRRRSELVSYYFNVYLLRRRAHQNRFDPAHIDSDDDELDKVGSGGAHTSSESILCSPKKVHLNSR